MHYSGSTITRVPFDVLSNELSVAFFLQTSIFVYNFYSEVNFCGKRFCGNFILLELIFADREENRKNRKIRTRKNLCYTVWIKLRLVLVPLLISWGSSLSSFNQSENAVKKTKAFFIATPLIIWKTAETYAFDSLSLHGGYFQSQKANDGQSEIIFIVRKLAIGSAKLNIVNSK